MAKKTIRRVLQKQFKDLSNWLDIKSSTLTRSNNSLFGNGGTKLSAKKLSVDMFYDVYRSHGDVFAVVRELSENTAMEGYVWKNRNDKAKEPKTNEVTFANDILGANLSFKRFKSQLIQTVSVAGNAYVHIERGLGTSKAIGLSFVDPRTMSVITDKYGNVIKWLQKVNSETVFFEPDEIAHFFIQKDPNSPVFGLSPLEPIFWEVKTDQEAMTSNYVFFENNAIPSAQYILDEDLSDDEQDRAITQLQEELKGAKNNHKGIAIRGVKDIKQLSLSPSDMEYNILRRFTTEKICSAYGVPKSILNYTEDVNLATSEEQTKKFWQGTILPIEETLAEFINTDLLPKLGIQNIVISFNPRTFDNQQWNEASSRADLSQGVMTINEVREARGLEPYDANIEGDFVDKPLLYSGVSVVPLEDVGVDPMLLQETTPSDQAKKEIELIKEASERYLYGTNTEKGND